MKSADALAKRMHKGYFRKEKEQNIFKGQSIRKKTLQSPLSLDEKIKIVYDVVVAKQKVLDVSKKYCRKVSTITNLVSKMKRNKEMIREAIDKQEQILNKERITR